MSGGLWCTGHLQTRWPSLKRGLGCDHTQSETPGVPRVFQPHISFLCGRKGIAECREDSSRSLKGFPLPGVWGKSNAEEEMLM